MTILLLALLVTVLALIILTRRWHRFPRALRIVTLYPLLLLLCFVLFARWKLHSSVPSDAAAVKRGKSLFENNCTGCHSLGQGRRIGPDLKFVGDRYDGTVLSLWMMNSDAVYQEYGRRPLSQSYPPMPRLGIEKKDADAISAYLASIADDNDQEVDAADGTQPGGHGD